MKKVFVFIVVILISICSYAQRLVEKEYAISVGIDVGYDMANYYPGHTLGIGLFAQGDYIFSDEASVTLNVQYLNFASKSVTDTINGSPVKRSVKAFKALPVLIGMKCNFAEKYYFHPQIGVAFFTSTRFPIAAAYRFSMGVITSKHTDFSIGYEGLQKQRAALLSFMTVRAAYTF
jgi:hypothetical protein